MKVTINLLPSSKKETIRIQQLTGMILKIGLSAGAAIVVFSLFLFSCLFIINIQKDSLEEESSRLKEIKVYSEVQKTYDIIDEYYGNTQNLSKGFSDQVSYVRLLEEVNSLIPDNLFLQEVSIAEEVMIINGFSYNREALIEFRDRIEEDNLFGSVDAPISNFTASENVNFIFTIDINK